MHLNRVNPVTTPWTFSYTDVSANPREKGAFATTRTLFPTKSFGGTILLPCEGLAPGAWLGVRLLPVWLYCLPPVAVGPAAPAQEMGRAMVGGGGSPPSVPTGLSATAGNQQVALSWNSSTGASSYPLARSTSSAGPYTQLAAPTSTSYTDQGLTNGTTYYYVVAAANSSGTSANSAPVSSTPIQPTATVNITIDVLTDRHAISPYIYGGAYPKDAAHITDSGTTVVRWGGNATSTYNWQLFTNNAAADWYFEDFNYSEIGDGDSAKFIQDVKAFGSNPLMTMVMLPWVAKSAETSTNGH